MSAESSSLGTCPLCESDVPQYQLLIEYEKGGRQAVFAECPECWEVIDPTR